MQPDGRVPGWFMNGEILGMCNCDWGCPCNFDAPPTYGHCDGVYTLVVHEGRFGDVDLAGAVFIMGGHSPGPIHEGGGTDILVLDERLSREQRDAIHRLWLGGGVGSPFDEFASVNETRFDPIVAPVEVRLDGIRSKVRVSDGAVLEADLSPVRNPVTGEEEEMFLDKPTGFTSKRTELGMTEVARFASTHLSFDVSGMYAEHGDFSYEGP